MVILKYHQHTTCSIQARHNNKVNPFGQCFLNALLLGPFSAFKNYGGPQEKIDIYGLYYIYLFF